MAVKHTPGPWKAYMGDNRLAPTVHRGDGDWFMVSGNSVEQNNADARLIAAAPELLEALIEIAGVESLGDSDAALDFVREFASAAIAKATGES